MDSLRHRFSGGGLGQLLGIPIVPVPARVVVAFANVDTGEGSRAAAAAKRELWNARRIPDGRRRHGQVKHARDALKHARKVANHA